MSTYPSPFHPFLLPSLPPSQSPLRTQLMDTLGSVICYPQFKAWEVEDTKEFLPLDLAQAQASPTTLVLEGVHQLAFRSATD